MVKHVYGSQSSYNKLVSQMLIDDNTLYVCEDSHRLYKGYKLVGNDAINISDRVPEFLEAYHDKLYIVKPEGDTFHFYIKGLTAMEEISFNQSIITSLDCFKNNTLLRKADGLSDNDDAVPTAAAVWDRIESIATRWNKLI